MDALVEQYSTGLVDGLLALVEASSLDTLFYQDQRLKSAVDNLFVSFDMESLKVDKIVLFNGIFTNCVLQLDTKFSEGEPNIDKRLVLSLLLLDTSIYLAFEKYSGLNPVPMQTLNSLMLLNRLEFVVESFGPVFFSKSSEDRQLKLTLGNSLVGKAKPGSTLLQIGNVLLPRLLGQIESHDVFATNLVVFITNAFDINDKLLLTSDWKINPFDRTYLDFSKSRKWPATANRNPNRRTADAFHEYMVLALYFTTDFNRLVEELNAYRGGRYGKTAIPMVENCKKLVKIIKELDSQSAAPKQGINHRLTAEEETLLVNSFLAKNYECDWLLNADEFAMQLNQSRRRLAIAFQIYVMVSFLYDLTETKWSRLMTEINAKYKKFRKPDFEVMLTNDSVKSSLAEVLTEIERHYAAYYPGFHRVLKHVVDNTEIRWRALKLRQFNHESLADLRALSDDKKRKLDEHLAAEHATRAFYVHKMGTPRLSQIWGAQTGLEEIQSKLADPEEILDNYKDELYFVEGNLASDENNQELKEKQELLTWKKQRLERGLGGWVKL
ncbi:hypothetical protein OGAPHI_003883 [Ogataea philodendri]|uniref:Uncharacterized protein n=1 Tax=Ogataea philodendri TaxID=1378263 RepID=A0A9P8P624_9ASCO|nr:uncharacterized protein OGAPHI_003883 [Ogataea philodendri]KAH3665695.1 hypothetical protein OGAPHI_003883 [Ogataea philodendri]